MGDDRKRSDWFWRILGAVGGLFVLMAQMPFETMRSNLATYVDAIGLNEFAASLPQNIDAWATAGGAAAVAAAIVGLYFGHRSVSAERDSAPSLTDGEWILHFNPKIGYSKPLTFLKDGTIGKGRNKNEWQWTINGKNLAIWREDGSLQNRFEHVVSPDKFVFVPDPDAQGIKDQFIERA